jgi:hypothetical protein
MQYRNKPRISNNGIGRFIGGRLTAKIEAATAAWRQQVSDAGASRAGKSLMGGNEAMKRGVWRGQMVGKGAKRTGKGALRVISRAKLVGIVTLRVSKADRRNGEMKGLSGGEMEANGTFE